MLIPFLAFSLFLPFHASAAKSVAKTLEPPAIELTDLVRIFALPKGAKAEALGDWKAGAKGFGAKEIQWKSAKPEKEGKAFSRRADIRIKVKGKKIPSEYAIELKGTEAGYDSVEFIGLAVNHDVKVPHSALSKAFQAQGATFHLVKCDSEGMASDSTLVSEVGFNDRNPSWLMQETSCGSHGCGISFTLLLKKSELDAHQDFISDCQDKLDE